MGELKNPYIPSNPEKYYGNRGEWKGGCVFGWGVGVGVGAGLCVCARGRYHSHRGE